MNPTRVGKYPVEPPTAPEDSEKAGRLLAMVERRGQVANRVDSRRFDGFSELPPPVDQSVGQGTSVGLGQPLPNVSLLRTVGSGEVKRSVGARWGREGAEIMRNSERG